MSQTISCHLCLFPTFLILTRPVSHSVSSIVLSIAVPQGQVCACTSPPTRLLVYLFFPFGRSRSPTRSYSFIFFTEYIGPWRYLIIPFPYLNPPFIFSCSFSSTARRHTFIPCYNARGGGGERGRGKHLKTPPLDTRLFIFAPRLR